MKEGDRLLLKIIPQLLIDFIAKLDYSKKFLLITISIPLPFLLAMVVIYSYIDDVVDGNDKFAQLIIILITLVIIFFFYLLYGSMYISVIQAIKELHSKTLKWISGDFSSRINIMTTDELKQVGTTFNQLADSFETKLKSNFDKEQQLKRLLYENNQLVGALNNLEIGVVISDPNRKMVIYVNQGFVSLTGYSENEIKQGNYHLLLGPNSSTKTVDKILSSIKNKTTVSEEILLYRKNGEPFWCLLSFTPICKKEHNLNFIWILKDVTKDKEAAESVYNLAYYDQLTKLPNYNSLEKKVDYDVNKGVRKVAICLIDISRFRYLNQNRGFEFGDLTLIEISKRISFLVKGLGYVYRNGGDRFAIYFPNTNNDSISIIIDSLHEQFHKPLHIKGITSYISLKIGVSTGSDDKVDLLELLRKAEVALFKAKIMDTQSFISYTQQLDDEYEEEYALENDLRNALVNNECILHYHPKVDLETDAIVGLEALIRWNHPTKGLISPNMFIPIAEKIGFIYELGKWALTNACIHNKRLIDKGIGPLIVSVNISSKEFNNRRFLSIIDEALTQSNLDPKYLELELTESVLQNPKDIKPILQEIKARNIKISIDDFGTGYSSLSYLKELPVDILKIDQSFMKQFCVNFVDRKLVEAMINMGKGLGLNIIAEGVETEEQVQLLKELACNEIQGYYVSKPLTVDALFHFLKGKEVIFSSSGNAF